MKKVFVVVGTRPEAIKMIPLYLELCKKQNLNIKLVSTGQHRELLDSVFNEFAVRPHYDLRIMEAGQTLSLITSKILLGLESLFRADRPDLVLAHGDTSTCFATALSCFYHSVPFFHVEAGLRTHLLDSPFPEEFNRQSVAQFAAHHFAPTDAERQNLLQEGVSRRQITVSGNTILDAVAMMAPTARKQVLVTLHRREKGAQALRSLFEMIKRIASRRTDLIFVFPLHPSPQVRLLAEEVLKGLPQVQLKPALPYREFLQVLKNSDLVMTDSGGIQEEANALRKKTLLLRDQTERGEGLDSGDIRLVGTHPMNVELALHQALPVLPVGKPTESPSRKIAEVVSEYLGSERLSGDNLSGEN